MLECHGTLRYRNTWLVVDVDDELGRYYRYLAGKTIQLNKPLYQSHITVIAGDRYEKPDKTFWGKYEGETIHFTYDCDVVQDKAYFWMRVYCSRIEDIRHELGLPRIIPVPWHLTIGNTKNL